LLDNYLTEAEFVDEAKARGIKMTRRTARKWRAQRRLPFVKVNDMILIPRNWPDQLRLIPPRHA
jgi:hypothetical protein